MLGIPMPCMPINPASCCVMLLPIPPNMLNGLPPFSSDFIMLGLPSAPRPCPPSMPPIMPPRPASLNMPCMLLGAIRPPIKPPIILGIPPELPGTSLMISNPGSSPALVLRSLERDKIDQRDLLAIYICRVVSGLFTTEVISFF